MKDHQDTLNKKLLMAVNKGEADEVTRLVSEGADTRYCWNASLNLAVSHNNTEIIRLLVNSLPEKDRVSVHDLDPDEVKRLIHFGQSQTIECLLEHGYLIEETQKKSCILLAIDHDSPRMIEYLFEREKKLLTSEEFENLIEKSILTALSKPGSEIIIDLLNQSSQEGVIIKKLAKEVFQSLYQKNTYYGQSAATEVMAYFVQNCETKDLPSYLNIVDILPIICENIFPSLSKDKQEILMNAVTKNQFLIDMSKNTVYLKASLSLRELKEELEDHKKTPREKTPKML